MNKTVKTLMILGVGGFAATLVMELIELFDRCGERLKVNTGVRHIMGLLAVDGIPDRKENQ